MTLVNGKIVGVGEKTVVIIVKILLPDLYVNHQVDLQDLLPPIDYEKEPYLKNMRQDKESVDIVLSPENAKKIPIRDQDHSKIILIRVQNIDHKGLIKGGIDGRQYRDLKEFYPNIVDIKWHEASEIFTERYNEKSIQEVIDAFKTCKVEIPNRKG